MNGTVERGSLKHFVFCGQARATLDQQLDHIMVIAADCLVQRSGVGVIAFGIVAVWILAGIEQKLHNIAMAMLRG